MDIQKDLLLLQYSDNFIIRDIDEREIDLNLNQNEDKNSSVIGKVVDDEGRPIGGATVKLFDKDGRPFRHLITADDGTYSFENLTAGSYSLTAVKKGSKLTVPKNIVLLEEEIKLVDFALISDVDVALGVVTGVLFDSDSRIRLSNAKVNLISDKTKENIASTMIADDGEFVFYDVPNGDYLLVASKAGYASNSPIHITIVDNAIVNCEVKIYKDIVTNTGTVNGSVKSKGVPVDNVYVGLYSVSGEDNERVETLVAYTKTNKLGAYMFGNVVAGNYVVKAKQNKQK